MIQDFDVKTNTADKIVFRKYPCIEWTVGFAFFATFSFSEYMIQLCNVEQGNEKMFHSYTQLFLLAFCLYGCVYSLYEGEFESITFDRKSETVLVRYTNFLCKKRYYCHALADISSVRAVERGRKGPSETAHYILCIYMKSGQMVKILWSKNAMRIKKQLLLIRKFLKFELEKPIAIVDMSTADYEEKKDLKTRILHAYREAKKPLVTSESISQRKNREEKSQKEKEDKGAAGKQSSARSKKESSKAAYLKESLNSKARHMKFD